MPSIYDCWGTLSLSRETGTALWPVVSVHDLTSSAHFAPPSQRDKGEASGLPPVEIP